MQIFPTYSSHRSELLNYIGELAFPQRAFAVSRCIRRQKDRNLIYAECSDRSRASIWCILCMYVCNNVVQSEDVDEELCQICTVYLYVVSRCVFVCCVCIIGDAAALSNAANMRSEYKRIRTFYIWRAFRQISMFACWRCGRFWMDLIGSIRCVLVALIFAIVYRWKVICSQLRSILISVC